MILSDDIWRHLTSIDVFWCQMTKLKIDAWVKNCQETSILALLPPNFYLIVKKRQQTSIDVIIVKNSHFVSTMTRQVICRQLSSHVVNWRHAWRLPSSLTSIDPVIWRQMLRHGNKCRQMSSNDVNFNEHNSTLIFLS